MESQPVLNNINITHANRPQKFEVIADSVDNEQSRYTIGFSKLS